MSRKLIHKCDGCGVEIVDDNDTAGMPSILAAGMRRRGTDSWGNLSISTGEMFGASFDLCDGCVKRVVGLLELEIPKPETVMRRIGGLGLGGHATPFMPGDYMAPPWPLPIDPKATPFGALSPEDLKALGIDIPGLRSSPPPTPPTPSSSVCASCGVGYKGPKPATCTMCGNAT